MNKNIKIGELKVEVVDKIKYLGVMISLGVIQKLILEKES